MKIPAAIRNKSAAPTIRRGFAPLFALVLLMSVGAARGKRERPPSRSSRFPRPASRRRASAYGPGESRREKLDTGGGGAQSFDSPREPGGGPASPTRRRES